MSGNPSTATVTVYSYSLDRLIVDLTLPRETALTVLAALRAQYPDQREYAVTMVES